jgi:CHAT domain-containing protein
MNSYTPIDDHTAIVGTNQNFARIQDTSFTGFTELKNASYLKLIDTKQVFLGTRGARLGDDTWLFGTAGGVVAYQRGTWYYPDRLNWMLPQDYAFAGNYGVRTVHAVAADNDGHIYVGNDRGLLIYDSGGGDSRSFLLSNQEYELGIQQIEQDKLTREQDILIASLDPNSEDKKIVDLIRAARKRMDQLESKAASPLVLGAQPDALAGDHATAPRDTSFAGAVKPEPDAVRAVSEELQQTKQQYYAALIRLNTSNPGLHDAMEPNPLFVSSIKDRIGENAVLLQYLLTPNTLFIHVVVHGDAHLIPVENVKQKDLEERSIRSWYRMSRGEVTQPPDALATLLQQGVPSLDEDLQWLYDRLIRPAEGAIGKRRDIYIVPAGSLNYVPFAALERSAAADPDYAVKYYNFGYMPSLYLFEQMTERHNPGKGEVLIMADPENSLAGSSAEARDISQILKSPLPPQLGKDASLSNLEKYGPGARVIHLATHGILDPVHPENSYLLLSNARLTMPDVMTLSLSASDIVVLSACETGIGGQGMEYFNVAYAFSYAKAPSVVATLWKIPDSTSGTLMHEFYTNLREGDDHFVALSKAQRVMLTKDRTARDPRSWAAFIPLGRP